VQIDETSFKKIERFCQRSVERSVTNIDDILQKFELALLKNAPLSLKYGSIKIDLYIGTTGGKPLYTVCWYDGGRRQRYGTTRTDSALEKIKSLVGGAELAREAGRKISYERVQEFVEADSVLQGVNISDLVRFYKEHIQTRSATLEEVCDLWLESAKEKSDRYRGTLLHYTNKLRAAFPRVQIGSITARMLDEYLVKTFPNPKTRVNHRGGVCSLFAFAQRKNFLPPGTTEAKKTERPTTKVVEPCVVESGDMIKLLNECTDKKLVAFLAIGGFAGCRAAEIIRMKWKHIHEDSIVLSPEITKTNRRRIAEIPENLAKWLAPLRGKPEDFVTYPSVPKVYEKVATLFRKVGVPREQNALRHTFVSCHLERHCDPQRTAKSAGHSLAVLEQNYLKLVSKKDAEAWFNILPPENKEYVEVVERRPTAHPPGRKTWRQIAAARNATVKVAKTKCNKQTEKDQHHA
jgi:integrase